MGALCSCLGGDSPKESKEPNNQAPGAVVNTSEASSRAGLAAIRRAEQFANTPAGKAAHKVAKAKTSLAPNRGGEPTLKLGSPQDPVVLCLYQMSSAASSSSDSMLGLKQRQQQW
ncbi:unnamed protein product [Sphagnum troendelagicum]|uniref:Uncharacterized protein n=1 Tax=Sphagnum troendelagicum TaxID=128251 RepID=A0ABP0TZY7_9BRYO